MEQAKIVNLAQVLKTHILKYIEQNKEKANRPDDFDDVALGKYIHGLIYESERGALLRDFVEIQEVSIVFIKGEGYRVKEVTTMPIERNFGLVDVIIYNNELYFKNMHNRPQIDKLTLVNGISIKKQIASLSSNMDSGLRRNEVSSAHLTPDKVKEYLDNVRDDALTSQGVLSPTFPLNDMIVSIAIRGCESEYLVSLKISQNCIYHNADFSTPEFEIEKFSGSHLDESYLNSLMDKYIPKGLYKNSPQFKTAKVERFETTEIEIWRNTVASDDPYCKNIGSWGEVCIFFFNDHVEELFKTKAADFLNDPKQLILEATDKYTYNLNTNLNEVSTYHGIRLYKLPNIDYSKEYIVIDRLLTKLNDIHSMYEIKNYLSSCMSFELSPDNYLELYATITGFDLLFKNHILLGHSLGKIFTAMSWHNDVESLILEKRFGSPDNQFFDEARIYIMPEGREV